MALEKGDRVIFTKDVGGKVRPWVSKGTEATVACIAPEGWDRANR